MTTEPYKRIPCGVYDHLELAAMRRTPVKIRYRDANHQLFSIEDVLVNLKTIEKVEYAFLGSGLQIRLDWIIQFNDIVLQDALDCTE
ncbi:MAG TPA: hypothetical protein ENK85_04495 [Saprospiraceae bacterium]|nr:hypothetical protein [Saprospiraceae bacterium]